MYEHTKNGFLSNLTLLQTENVNFRVRLYLDLQASREDQTYSIEELCLLHPEKNISRWEESLVYKLFDKTICFFKPLST